MKILLAQFYSHQPTPDYDKIAEALNRLGHTVLVGTPNADGAIVWRQGDRVVAQQAAPGRVSRSLARIPVVRQLADRWNRTKQVRVIQKFVRDFQPDVVQVNATGVYRWLPLGMPSSIKFVLDVRQINQAHGTGLVGGARSWLANSSRGFYSRRLYDTTTFLHEAGAQKVLGDDWQRHAVVVPMGVDPQFLAATRPVAARQGSADSPVRFIYIGRLTRRRLLERIIEAAALARQQNGNFTLTFMGYDDSNGYYGQEIARLGLDDIACVAPPIPYEAVPQAVLEQDVALAYVPEIPADWKYHPTLKILEYRALGLPVIASDFAPNRSFVEQGVNGLLVENNAPAIAAAMLRLIDDPEFLATCRQKATQMREGTSWETIAQIYLDKVYEPLATGNSQISGHSVLL